jgi:hypothetical protein
MNGWRVSGLALKDMVTMSSQFGKLHPPCEGPLAALFLFATSPE